MDRPACMAVPRRMSVSSFAHRMFVIVSSFVRRMRCPQNNLQHNASTQPASPIIHLQFWFSIIHLSLILVARSGSPARIGDPASPHDSATILCFMSINVTDVMNLYVL